MIKWKEPESRQNARERCSLLLDEIAKIDVQLGTRGRVLPNGREMAEDNYLQWRRSAKHAKAIKMSEYRYLTNWLHNHPSGWNHQFIEAAEAVLDSADKPEWCNAGLTTVSTARLNVMATLIQEYREAERFVEGVLEVKSAGLP